jgi:serine/threonine-protein kinase HipA
MTVPLLFEEAPVGEILVGTAGPAFAYAPSWGRRPDAFPLSLRMPIEGGAFEPEIVLPWLMNLLPEGPQLATVGRWLGVAPQDTMGVLEKIGRDVAGAVSVGRARASERPDYRRVGSDAELARIIDELPRRPFLAGEEGVALSLAGAQEKLPVALVDNVIAIPLGGASSTHILKPDNKHLYGSVQNEALCLVLAHRCGLRVAKATTGKVGDRSYLLVERYDRVSRDGIWRRIHQEDFCQALGKPPAAKYERNQSGIRGPRIADMFEVVKMHMTAADSVRLLDAIIFNVLVCNTDAHAKNYSILFHRRRAELAPLYDLMCAAAWDGISRNLAQTIGEKNRGDHIHARHWKRMAAECGLRGVAVVRRVDALSRRVSAAIDAACDEVRAMPAGDHPMLLHFAEAIRRRCVTVRANLKTDAEEEADDRDSDGRTMEQA